MRITNKTREKILKDYTQLTKPYSFSGRERVRQFFPHLTADDVNSEILAYNYSYGLHRQAKRPRHYNPFAVFSLREQIQIDLGDFSKLAEYNDNIKFLLFAVDSFSRRLWVYPLKNKKGKRVLTCFKHLYEEELGRKLKQVVADRGTEIKTEHFSDYCKSNHVRIMHPNGESKAALCERVLGTLKRIIYAYLTEHHTFRYIDRLQDFVSLYNNRDHRTLKYFTPMEADQEENEDEVRKVLFDNWMKLFRKTSKVKNKKPTFDVGDRVRVQLSKRAFTKGHAQTFSLEQFIIDKIIHHLPVIMYQIKSLNTNDIIEGYFYKNELQLIKGDIYRIEKVVKTRRRGTRKQHLVRFEGFNGTHDRWIWDKDLMQSSHFPASGK